MPSLLNCLGFMESPNTQMTPKHTQSNSSLSTVMHVDSLTNMFTVKCRQPHFVAFIKG